MNQGEERTKFVKDEENPTSKYIFQWNTKTKIAFFFIVTVLLVIIVAIAISGLEL